MRNVVLLTIVLLLPWAGALALNRVRGRELFSPLMAGRVGLALVLLLAGSSHFTRPEEMSRMLPDWTPFRTALVLATGVIEVAAAAGLLIPRAARIAGWFLIAYFVAIYPANLWAAIHRVDFGGHHLGPVYLLVRTPLQVLFIFWAWRFAAAVPYKPAPKTPTPGPSSGE